MRAEPYHVVKATAFGGETESIWDVRFVNRGARYVVQCTRKGFAEMRELYRTAVRPSQRRRDYMHTAAH